jgi:hypothetical protein
MQSYESQQDNAFYYYFKTIKANFNKIDYVIAILLWYFHFQAPLAVKIVIYLCFI